jgi:hypothetical protein
MRTVAVTLASLLAACTLATAAPAPEEGRQAKQSLEILKRRLPGVVEAWGKSEDGPGPFVPSLQEVRATGESEARVVVYMRYPEADGKRGRVAWRLVLSLTYFDGAWSAGKFEWTTSHPEATVNSRWKLAAQVLGDALDEAAEK